MMNVQEYLESLAQTAGLDDEAKAGLKKALGNTKFAEELDKGVKRQSDYSRSMDELKTQKQAVDSQIGQWREWYNTAVTRDAEREEELQRLKAGGSGGIVTPATTATPANGFTKKDLEEREGRMINIVKQGMRLASRHAAKFGEELDTDALETLAVAKGLTLEHAYEEYVKPRVEEAQKKAHDEEIKLAHESGVREGLSKRDLPGEGEKSFHPIFGHSKAVAESGKLTDGQRATNFAEEWNKAALAKR
jgi:hypothetical protein